MSAEIFTLLIVGLVVVLAVVCRILWWRELPEERRQAIRKDRRERARAIIEEEKSRQASRKTTPQAKRVSYKTTPISQAGVKTDFGLACPNCKGMNFKAKRSVGKKVVAGTAGVVLTLNPVGAAALLLARKKRVKCVTCGFEFLRG